jgi:hypothetical protein
MCVRQVVCSTHTQQLHVEARIGCPGRTRAGPLTLCLSSLRAAAAAAVPAAAPAGAGGGVGAAADAMDLLLQCLSDCARGAAHAGVQVLHPPAGLLLRNRASWHASRWGCNCTPRVFTDTPSAAIMRIDQEAHVRLEWYMLANGPPRLVVEQCVVWIFHAHPRSLVMQ